MNRILTRNASILLVLLLLTIAAVGCGDDNKDGNGEPGKPPALGNVDKEGEDQTEAEKKKAESKPEDDANKPKFNVSKEPPPVLIDQDISGGIKVDKPTLYIIQDSAKLKKLAKDIRTPEREKDAPPIPVADWKSRQYVLAVMPKSKPGTIIQIVAVFEENGKIVAQSLKLLPGAGCKTPAKFNRPYQIVETRRMKGTPTLDLSSQDSSPCSK